MVPVCCGPGEEGMMESWVMGVLLVQSLSASRSWVRVMVVLVVSAAAIHKAICWRVRVQLQFPSGTLDFLL